MKHNFPKWLFHKELAPEGKIIRSQGELDALGDGWKETPAAFSEEQTSKAKEPQGDQSQGEQAKTPIKETDYTKWKVADLKAFLIERGVFEDSLDGLKKDELIARIGAL